MSGDPFAGGSTNVLDGGAGNDRIEGELCRQRQLFGGDGADTIPAGAAAQDGTDDDFIEASAAT